MNKEMLKNLSDQQLRELLLAEFEVPEANVELIQMVTDILIERHPEDRGDASEAYRVFTADYAETEPLYEDEKHEAVQPWTTRKRRKWVRLALIAAVLIVAILGSATVAYAAGIDIWGIIRGWTQETFGFGNESQNDLVESGTPNPIDFLNETLEDNGIQPLTNILIPDGYECILTNVVESRRGKLVTAEFSDGNNDIMLAIQEYIDVDASRYFPKDDPDPAVLNVDGVDYYLTDNYDWKRLVWSQNNTIVSVTVSDSEVDLSELIVR